MVLSWHLFLQVASQRAGVQLQVVDSCCLLISNMNMTEHLTNQQAKTQPPRRKNRKTNGHYMCRSFHFSLFWGLPFAGNSPKVSVWQSKIHHPANTFPKSSGQPTSFQRKGQPPPIEHISPTNSPSSGCPIGKLLHPILNHVINSPDQPSIREAPDGVSIFSTRQVQDH